MVKHKDIVKVLTKINIDYSVLTPKEKKLISQVAELYEELQNNFAEVFKKINTKKLTMNQIADQLGLTRQTLYNHKSLVMYIRECDSILDQYMKTQVNHYIKDSEDLTLGKAIKRLSENEIELERLRNIIDEISQENSSLKMKLKSSSNTSLMS